VISNETDHLLLVSARVHRSRQHGAGASMEELVVEPVRDVVELDQLAPIAQAKSDVLRNFLRVTLAGGK
jgi:hypothetical protein